jgi:hypothetical protein
MRLRYLFATVATIAGVIGSVSAFAPPSWGNIQRASDSGWIHRVALYSSENGCDKACDIPSNLDAGSIDLDIFGKTLRSTKLTNAEGQLVRLGDAMGKGTSVVVFLRHLG